MCKDGRSLLPVSVILTTLLGARSDQPEMWECRRVSLVLMSLSFFHYDNLSFPSFSFHQKKKKLRTEYLPCARRCEELKAAEKRHICLCLLGHLWPTGSTGSIYSHDLCWVGGTVRKDISCGFPLAMVAIKATQPVRTEYGLLNIGSCLLWALVLNPWVMTLLEGWMALS